MIDVGISRRHLRNGMEFASARLAHPRGPFQGDTTCGPRSSIYESSGWHCSPKVDSGLPTPRLLQPRGERRARVCERTLAFLRKAGANRDVGSTTAEAVPIVRTLPKNAQNISVKILPAD